MISYDIDLLVVGGGFGGFVMVLYVCVCGFLVIVVEFCENFIDKVCGEGLMFGGLVELILLGVDLVGLFFYGIVYVGEYCWV